jgi:putative DNA methylase
MVAFPCSKCLLHLSNSRNKAMKAVTMATKKEFLAQQIAQAVGAGKPAALETVDFSDPERPKTCLEVDFPILPVNQVAALEGNASKPIYQMSKWWARRRSSVFRSLLIAAATKAPADPAHAAKLVWDNYYANHQKRGAFSHLKVADIFMGGGTTLVEGSRLGMQLFGNDLNPMAWFVVKQELAEVEIAEVKNLLADIAAEVRPQIMPFYYCDGPNGEKGTWTHVSSGSVQGPEFDPLSLSPQQRMEYHYEGPEIIYTFWAKHAPCPVTGCGHRTPILANPVVAVKTLTVKSQAYVCESCHNAFDVEDRVARMAPGVPLYVVPTEHAYSVYDSKLGAVCPHCGHAAQVKLDDANSKKVQLSLLLHPDWQYGSQGADAAGQQYGGSSQDAMAATARWNEHRAAKIRLLEVRGPLPDMVTCPETYVTFSTSTGAVPRQGHFTCAACGTASDQVGGFAASGKNGPLAGYAIHGFARKLAMNGDAYNGRFFAPFGTAAARQYNAVLDEWEARRDADLAGYWPEAVRIPPGHEAHQRRPLGQHGYHFWTDFFNPRQLLVHALLLKAIVTVGNYSRAAREYVLGAFQQYLRNQSLFCFWNMQGDKPEPQFSNNNFHPKTTAIENCVFSDLGRGNWASCVEGIIEGKEWAENPWDTVSVELLKQIAPGLGSQCTGKSAKVHPGDPVRGATITQGSSTELADVPEGSLDLVITDPPFGDLVQYAELADFFYAWMRLPLQHWYPQQFASPYTPKTLEAVANRFREPEDPNGFYQRLLTQCWREAHRTLKPSGILAFTFHHSDDEPWVAVLESLFEAGFYLEATYPIRSDETKGEGQFGSQKIEYDIIHVCRKQTNEPKPVSWGRMRREVLADVRQLQALLENHAKAGLPAADLQVIRRGKALEYFSRHYGKVYVDEGRTISVKEALVGINQLIDEDANRVQEPPPVNAEPMTRQFLRIFDGKTEVARDQMQKYLRGSGLAPNEFEERGWCKEVNKVFTLIEPLQFAQEWYGRHKRRLVTDLDQALVLIGACYDGSGISAADTLKNENFKAHPALKSLLEWLSRRSTTQAMRNAASRALSIHKNWAATNQQHVHQLTFFDEE